MLVSRRTQNYMETCVIPVLDYELSIWGHSNHNHSEIIQNKSIGYFLGSHNYTPVPALQGEMGWLNCKYRKQFNMLNVLNRVINMSENRIPKMVFNFEYDSRFQNCIKETNIIEYL